MVRSQKKILTSILLFGMTSAGCQWAGGVAHRFQSDPAKETLQAGTDSRVGLLCDKEEIPDHPIQQVSSFVETPLETCPENTHPSVFDGFAPRSIADRGTEEFWDLSLSEAVKIALQNSPVLKDLGGRVLTSPETVQTTYDPAIRESAPLYGVEGALSAFDTQLANSFLYSKNDRSVNNITLGGGTRDIQQDIANYTLELSKTAATGSRFAMRNITVMDASNQPGNLFGSAWDTQFEFEARQPLLQGAGVEFNRIAGPNAQPGFNFSSGVLVARTNTDINVAELETGLRDFTSQVEEAYWELYYAYRNLDAWKQARDAARQTWEDIKAQQGLPGGTAEREARARVQFFIFQDLANEALNGNPREGNSIGIYRGERRLRMLLGLPNNDGSLIRPLDQPIQAKVDFDWDIALAQALSHRSEIRRQKWVIKRDQLELTASKNFTKPRLDLVGLGRIRGFGDDLIGGDGSAFRDARSGDHPEWQAGIELTVPIGFRRAHAGVRHAELKLMRDRAILREQELQVAHGLGDAISEVDRAYESIRTNFNRLDAAQQRLTAAQAVYDVDKISIDLVLDAQQELSQSMSAYYDAITDYQIAMKNVHFETGTLLTSHEIYMSEGPWSEHAYEDSLEEQSRLIPKPARRKENLPGIISAGPSAQVSPRFWRESPQEPQPSSQPTIKAETAQQAPPLLDLSTVKSEESVVQEKASAVQPSALEVHSDWMIPPVEEFTSEQARLPAIISK